jgi:large subunit ribosomal protein L21
MYALVEIKGKQYKAEKGALLKVDRFDSNTGEILTLESVLLVSNEDKTEIGHPFVQGAKITAVVEDHTRGSKVVIYKYKKRKNYRRRTGHRQQYTLLRVQEIVGA